jgi:tRNA(adenine34) deaminase
MEMMVDERHYMHMAYQEALKALDEGEVPIGAVIVRNGRVVGRGYNRVESLADATAHAEIIAMSAASASVESWRLNDCRIYVTLEPCLMCLGALLQARIGTIVYGATDSRLGAIRSHRYREVAEGVYTRFPEIIEGVLADECRELIQTFFRRLRKKN